jgi:hypothetical protein
VFGGEGAQPGALHGAEGQACDLVLAVHDGGAPQLAMPQT